MNINEFTALVADYISENYEGLTVIPRETVKNNGVILRGITIKHSDNDAILPTIYLEAYLDEFNNNTPIEKIVNRILEVDERTRVKESPDLHFFSEFEKVKDKLFLKIINTKENDLLLNKVPHIHFLDLSIVVYCDMSDVIGMSATVLVRNEHVRSWEVLDKQVLDAAYKNTRDKKLRIRDVAEIAKESLNTLKDYDLCELSEIENCTEKMFVMTTEKMIYGAACVIFDDVLDSFIGDRWKGVYIIPSSVHEVILVPDSEEIKRNELNSMISDVNRKCLSKEEILSENAYYYSVREGYSIV